MIRKRDVNEDSRYIYKEGPIQTPGATVRDVYRYPWPYPEADHRSSGFKERARKLDKATDYAVLLSVGQYLIQSAGSEPSLGSSTQEIVKFLAARNTMLFNAGSYLSTLSAIPMLGLLASLRGVRRSAEREDGWLTIVATGAGLGFLALLVGGEFWHIDVFRNEEIDPQIVSLLFYLCNCNFDSMWVVLGALLFAVGIATLRFRGFPTGISWLSLVVGLDSSLPEYSGPRLQHSLHTCFSGCG